MASPKRPRKTRQQKSLKFFHNIRILTSLLFIVAGAGVLLYTSIQNIGFITKPKVPVQASQDGLPVSKPVKLYIPPMSKLLDVSDGYAQGDRWEISQTGVSYLTTSALPGKGNTIIYGHNTKDILGGLWRVQEGDYIYVVLTNGDFAKYRVSERKEIDPSQVEILNQSNDSRLTLYTCSGFLDTARFVVVAKEVEKSI